MSPPTKKHGKKAKKDNNGQPVSATLHKAPKASVDDLDQTIPLIQVLQAPPVDPNAQQPLSNRRCKLTTSQSPYF